MWSSKHAAKQPWYACLHGQYAVPIMSPRSHRQFGKQHLAAWEGPWLLMVLVISARMEKCPSSILSLRSIGSSEEQQRGFNFELLICVFVFYLNKNDREMSLSPSGSGYKWLEQADLAQVKTSSWILSPDLPLEGTEAQILSSPAFPNATAESCITGRVAGTQVRMRICHVSGSELTVTQCWPPQIFFFISEPVPTLMLQPGKY